MNTRFLHKSTSIHLLVTIFIFVFIAGCGEQQPDLPVILKINDEPIYIDELELLGRMAVTKAGLDYESEEGQKHYKEITPNLYNTLIDLYAIQKAAKAEGVSADEETVDAEYDRFVQQLRDQGGYDRFMSGLGLDEDRLRELIQDMLAMNILQETKLNEGKREPTDEEVKNYYYQNNPLFRFPNRLRASHIFFEAKDTDGETAHARANDRAQQILKMMNDDPASNFVKLAQTYSEDTGNAPRGGDLGFITRDSVLYPESFKQAVWSLSEGEVSGVVNTNLGYHIIWVTDHEQSLEEAASEIKRHLTQQAMSKHFEQWKSEARRNIDIKRYFNPTTYTVLEQPLEDVIKSTIQSQVQQ